MHLPAYERRHAAQHKAKRDERKARKDPPMRGRNQVITGRGVQTTQQGYLDRTLSMPTPTTNPSAESIRPICSCCCASRSTTSAICTLSPPSSMSKPVGPVVGSLSRASRPDTDGFDNGLFGRNTDGYNHHIGFEPKYATPLFLSLVPAP